MTVVDITNRELYFAASLIARPELVNAVFPPQNVGSDGGLLRVENTTARAAITILSQYGPTYANPSAMLAALSDVPADLDGEDVTALISLIPHPDSVELSDLIEAKTVIDRSYGEKKLRRDLLGAANKPAEDAVSQVEKAVRDYRQGSIGRDHSGKGIVERMRQGKVTTRWKFAAGIEGGGLLDDQALGVGPDGQFSSGICGQGEVVVITAKYGVGKTRWALNGVLSLLQQGASIDLLVGEDNEATYLAKLMGAQFGLPKWKIERYVANTPVYLNDYGREEAIKIEEALDWSSALNLRIYDGEGSKVDIFRFPAAKGLLEESAAVNGTTHTLVDYIQIWKGETATLEGYAQEMRAFAARNNVGLLLLSQIPNDAMKYGVTPGMLPSKGTGDWGQIAHWGYLLDADPIVGQKELSISQQKGRDAGLDQMYAHFDVVTGRVLEMYGTPKFGELPDMGQAQPKHTKGGKRK